MSTLHSAAAPYAVLRVDRRKAKAMGAIAASSAHTMRERPTPNADPEGPAPVVMHLADGKTPYQAARHLLEGAERRNRDTVLCREIVLSASPSYFRPGRESMGGVFELGRVKAWAAASLAWAKRQWPDQLASAVLHLDEQTPHMHLLVVPRVRSAAGVWKLNSKALFDRDRLRDLQTGYGEALAPLGIKRGEPGSQAEHSEVRQFYGAVNASKSLPERAKLPPAPRARHKRPLAQPRELRMLSVRRWGSRPRTNAPPMNELSPLHMSLLVVRAVTRLGVLSTAASRFPADLGALMQGA